MGMYTENREILIHAFAGFLSQVEYQKEHGEFVSTRKSAESFVDNEIACEKGMEEYYNYLSECERSDKRLMKVIKKIKGRRFMAHVWEIVGDDQTCGTKIEIARHPTGDFQEENYGRLIKGYWVDQWSVGTEGDSFSGYIYIEVRKDRYLRFRCSI